MISTLQLSGLAINIATVWDALLMTTDTNESARYHELVVINTYITLPIDILFATFWSIFMYQGTTQDVLFSRNKLLLIGLLMITDVSTTGYGIVMAT